MSKRSSPKQSNTIDKYFEPSQPKKPKLNEAGEPSTSQDAQDQAVQTVQEPGPSVQEVQEPGPSVRIVPIAGETNQALIEVIENPVLAARPAVPVTPAQKRIGRTGRPRKNSPRPGPSSAPDGASMESINRPLMLSHMDTLEGVDTSSMCSSSDTQTPDVGHVQSLEEMDVDDASLMTVDSSSSVERDTEYKLDWTGSRM